MKRVLATVIVSAMTVAAFSTASMAADNNNAKIQLHLLAPTSKNACTRLTAKPACSEIVTHGSLYPTTYYAYVLVTDANVNAGIAGLQFGITYNGNPGQGVDIFGWTLCATLEFQQPTPVWPATGGGNLITWDFTNACQTFVPLGNDATNGVCADAGYFYLAAYNADDLFIGVRPVDGSAKVASCAAVEDVIEDNGLQSGNIVHRTPSHLGTAGFDNDTPVSHPGYNPCGLDTPVENTTWSSVKSLYSTGR